MALSVPSVIFYLLVVNILTYGVFALDKYRALHNGWRVPENCLLLVAVLGGSPAIKLGQKQLRHKTQKQPFKGTLNFIILFQLIVGSVILLWMIGIV